MGQASHRARYAFVVTVVVLAAALTGGGCAWITRASSPLPSNELNGQSFSPTISDDGAYIAFTSAAANVLPGRDTNGGFDVFRYSRATGAVDLVSITTSFVAGNAASSKPSISQDGRFVAFESDASNLVPGDTNGVSDVFVRDMLSGVTARASVLSGGAEANGPSHDASIGGDGRYVAFDSTATNLVSGDSNGVSDVFLRDLNLGSTRRVSVGRNGAQATSGSLQPSVSTDGRYVAFQSSNAFFVGDLNGTTDIYVFDANAGSFPAGQALIVSHTPQPAPQSPIFAANGPSQNAKIARDGTTIAYESNATDLGPADTNGASDVYAWATASDSTLLVSRTAAGAAGNGGSSVPSVSSDGTKIAFASDASNLVSGDTNSLRDSFVRDMTTAATARASIGAGKVQGKQPSSVVAVSDSGRFAAFESAATEFVDDDLNGVVDVYLRDAQTDTTRRVHPEPNASSSQSSLDTGGRFMSFTSFASNLTTSPIADTNGLTDIYVRNSTSGATTLTSVGWNGSAVVPTNGQSQNSVISGNSRWVAFESFATNLRRGDPLGSTDTNGFVDVYVADRTTGATVRVSQAGDGTQALGSNRNPSISDDGRFVAFESDATGLDPVGIDNNGTTDVFVHDRDSDGNGIFDQVGGTTTRLVSSVFLAPSLRASANGASSDPAISGNGAFLTYTSAATNLPFAPSGSGITDTNGVNDIFRVTLANLDDVVLMSATVAGNTIQLANGASLQPTISDNGLEVAYASLATNLAGFTFDTNGQPDVFSSARATGPPGTKLVVTSVVTWVLSSPGTVTANGSSTSPAMSGDGKYIAYESTATNLVANDTNGTSDVFVEDRTRGIVNGYGARELASTDTNLVHGSASSSQVAIAGDAHTVSFTTLSTFDTDDVGGFDVYTRAALVPDFSFPAQVSPSAVARGATATLDLRSAGFVQGGPAPYVYVTADVIVNSVSWIDGSHLTISVTVLANATPGLRNILVANQSATLGAPYGAAGLCTNCFNVT